MSKPVPPTPSPAATPIRVAAPPAAAPASAPAPKQRKPKVEIIEVPDVDIVMEEWRMCVNKLKPGQDIEIKVTLRNLGSRMINDKMSIRVGKDAYFQSCATPMNKAIPPAGEVQVDMVLKVNGGIVNLNTLPNEKEIMLVKDGGVGKLIKVASMSIRIPMEPFIRHLKEEFAPIRILLWGMFGTGKSSFTNSLATLYNEDPRFPNKKLNPAFSRPSTTTVTMELKQYVFDNVTIFDSWGWEEANKGVYTDLVFQLMLAGRLGSKYAMEDARKLTVRSLPNTSAKPMDLALFFITVSAVRDEAHVAYLNQLNHAIKETQKLGIPFLVLLTQIDKVEPSLKQNPYCLNPTIQELTSQVCAKIELDETHVVPVVNYTRETERTWEMDRAAFVTLYRAFQARADCERSD